MGHITQEPVDEFAREEDLGQRNGSALPSNMPGSINGVWSSIIMFWIHEKIDACMKVRTLARNCWHRNESFPALHVTLAWVDAMRFKTMGKICEKSTKEQPFILQRRDNWNKDLPGRAPLFKLSHPNYSILQCLSPEIIFIINNNTLHDILQTTCVLIITVHSKLKIALNYCAFVLCIYILLQGILKFYP